MDLVSVVRLGELADLTVPLGIRLVCELGIADLLRDGPRPVRELARDSGCAEGPLVRVLRALATRGIFTEPEPGVFALTPLAAPLRSDHPMGLRDAFPLIPADIQAWSHLEHTVRTGECGFEHAHGQTFWDHLAACPADSARVDRWMRGINRLHLRTVLGAYPWGELGHVVDAGGGDGAFLAGLLARNPRMHGILVDLPHVVAGAPAVLAQAGPAVAGRCLVIPGSLFDRLPAGADAYVLKTVLPGFDDEDAVRALRTVRAAATHPQARVLLLEAVLPEGDAPDVAKLLDVHTMVLTGGAHRTIGHTTDLLRRAGLELHLVRPTATLTVLEARPVPQAGPAGG